MASYLSVKVMVALVAISAISISTTRAQAQTCASKLIPCGAYLNTTTKPPNSCCDPIKEAVATDLPCLCNLYKNPSFLSGIGINVTQALRLPRLCGLSYDASACDTAQSPGGSTTPATPGNITPPRDNGVGKIASSGVIGLFLISSCVILY
uniref:non-specific lipid transfer protein GPI-anchored 7-like isoform X2 n=1 Tax=Erigeron canadensis TaxID=72917 RepID=UPI001CB97BD0|nr:non-specific lipid transfer protein GPI-anchored 7-like isoform X2 [Erigeron canadensis]